MDDYIRATLEDLTGLRWRIEWLGVGRVRFVSCPVFGTFKKIIHLDNDNVWHYGVQNWVPLELGNDELVKEVLDNLLSYESSVSWY